MSPQQSDESGSVPYCAGLRNRIVHEYDEIDHRKVYEGLQATVRDIPKSLSGILESLRRT